ncbi:hypothetical protein [Sinomonas albida]|uniref:hypothetical protein n=1 Tax=Sinomonas albida TaxID=369942 RepID=UPI00301AD537
MAERTDVMSARSSEGYIRCHWRLLSTYSHAGMGLGDFYVKEIPEEPRLAFDSDAKLANHEAWWNCSVHAHLGNEGVQSHRWQGPF